MSKTDTIDLASLNAKEACEKGFEIELRHPVTDALLGVFISVVGSESETYQAHVRKKANERLRRQYDGRAKGRDEAPTVEKAEAAALDLLAACITGWRTGDKPTVTHGGKALEFGPANARFLLAEKWVRNQVDEAVHDLGNFMSN